MLKYPSKKRVKALTFDKSTSPFVFSNLITYSLLGDTIRQENNFYVTSISNMPEKEVFETRADVECGKQTLRIIKVAKISSPEAFYIRYSGQKGNEW